tara:strand:- start:3243 stop:4262 length:1020 start_codon:yes stop_codon:yes gene_type:complete
MAKFFSSVMVPNSLTTNMSIGECYNRLESGDLNIPPYQRDYVWTLKQQQLYLESISKGLPLFGPVINNDSVSGEQNIMDGQNRLYTVNKFMKDEITFENEDGEIIKYSELNGSMKRKFKNLKISYTETNNWSQEQCQEFFIAIQEGVKLKDGELIHAKSGNSLTKNISEIYDNFTSLFIDKSKDGGMGLTPAVIKRFGHYEIIGTIIHMIRTKKFPVRPGQTALKEFNLWSDPNTPTAIQREQCIAEANICLKTYSEIIKNVPKLVEGVKKEEHLRLLYFIYKSNLFNQHWDQNKFTKIENILNRVLNKENPEYELIIKWSTKSSEKIYDLYHEIFLIN